MRASSHPFRGARAFVACSFHPLPNITLSAFLLRSTACTSLPFRHSSRSFFLINLTRLGARNRRRKSSNYVVVITVWYFLAKDKLYDWPIRFEMYLKNDINRFNQNGNMIVSSNGNTSSMEFEFCLKTNTAMIRRTRIHYIGSSYSKVFGIFLVSLASNLRYFYTKLTCLEATYHYVIMAIVDVL